MSQVTGPLTINDGAATPVARTFGPERVSPDLTSFTEKTAVSASGYIRLSVAQSPASAKRPTHRIDLNLDYPVLQSVGGVSSVAYIGRFRGYFVVPENMTAAERANLAAFVANALDQSAIRSTVKDLDPLY